MDNNVKENLVASKFSRLVTEVPKNGKKKVYLPCFPRSFLFSTFRILFLCQDLIIHIRSDSFKNLHVSLEIPYFLRTFDLYTWVG